MMLADLDSLEKRIDALEKESAAATDKESILARPRPPLDRALAEASPRRPVARKPEESSIRHARPDYRQARPYFLQRRRGLGRERQRISNRVEAKAKSEGRGRGGHFAKIGAEIAMLPPASAPIISPPSASRSPVSTG